MKKFSEKSVLGTKLNSLISDGSFVSAKLQRTNLDEDRFRNKNDFLRQMFKNIIADGRLSRLNPRARAVILQRRRRHYAKSTLL